MKSYPISDSEVVEIVNDPDMMDADTFEVLFKHYSDNGEMPYGVAKCRTGDPDQWIHARLVERAETLGHVSH